MKSISTHVLDVSRGAPAEHVDVHLERKEGDAFVSVRRASTDSDGRVRDLVPAGQLVPATYRLTFDTGSYFERAKLPSFYPEAAVVFVVQDAEAHYHVPLLLSPFGYSTYRGS